MRDNNRVRRRFELSLDGKQVASIVVGALVVLGAVFVLGLSVGRQLAPRTAPPPRPENPLAALDRPAVPPTAPAEKEPRLSAHELLTKGQGEAPIAEPPPVRAQPGALATGTALNSLPPAPPEKPVPAPREEPAPKKDAAPAKAPPRPAARSARQDAVAAAVARVSGAPEGAGRFSVQIGASQSEAEAQRLQRRHAAEGARIAVADVPGKGTWYRVRVGAYPTRAEAERRLAALAQKGVKGFVAAGD